MAWWDEDKLDDILSDASGDRDEHVKTSGAERVKGDVGLVFRVGDTDYWADCTTIKLEQDDDTVSDWGDTDVTNPGDWKLKVSAVQSIQRGSLWRFLWENQFATPVDVTYAPAGNDKPTQDEPHFTGPVQIPRAPSLGGDAGEDEEYTFDTEFRFREPPELVTGD